VKNSLNPSLVNVEHRMSKRVAKMRHNPLGVDIAADRQPFDGNKGVRRKERDVRRAAALAREV
jgi:hypothetical protein